jgi:Kinetochore complex Sim4 subunit Fta1
MSRRKFALFLGRQDFSSRTPITTFHCRTCCLDLAHVSTAVKEWSLPFNIDNMPVHLATDGTHSTSESDLSQLYDSPWNVYKCFGILPTIQRDSLVARLKQFFDEDDAVRTIPGELLECTVDLISIQAGTNALSGVALRCLFDHKHLGTEFRLIHLNNPAKEVSLLLLRSGVPRQMLVDLFNEMLGLPPFEELKLPSSLLSSQLESYLETLVAYGPTHDPDSYIHSIVGNIDLKVTFEAPVSPNLRSLDINVPATEVWDWLSSSPHQQGTFLTRLTGHLQTNIGLRLGLGSLRGIPNVRNSIQTS